MTDYIGFEALDFNGLEDSPIIYVKSDTILFFEKGQEKHRKLVSGRSKVEVGPKTPFISIVISACNVDPNIKSQTLDTEKGVITYTYNKNTSASQLYVKGTVEDLLEALTIEGTLTVLSDLSEQV